MNASMNAVEAYNMCAGGYRDWRWSALWDAVEVPVVVACLPISGTVIDLGCGYGRYLEPCSSRGLDYVGVDASEEMLLVSPHARGSFVCANLYDYRAAVPADAVLCARVLSNLRDPQEALQSVSRNLVPGGMFILTDFHERHRFERQTVDGRDGRDVDVPVFRHSPGVVRRAIRAAELALDDERVIHEEAGKPMLVMYRGTKPG